MPTITTADRTQLYVKDWGTGKPVILLHGWPLSSDTWDDQAMAIAQSGYRAIAYDRREFGRSSQPWNGYDYNTLADDLAAVIEQTKAQNAVLVGFSMGGGEVARYMSRHTKRSIHKVALVASVVPFMLKTFDNPCGTEQGVFDSMLLGIKEDRAIFFANFFKSFFGINTAKNPMSVETLRWACGLAMQASLKATLECARSFSSTDFRGDLASFDVPTLVIHGTADLTVPINASGRAVAKSVPHSKLIEYEGSPHGLFATDKERLTKDLLTFLAEN